MNRLAPLCVVLWACSRTASPDVTVAPTAHLTAPCDAQTALQPGIPGSPGHLIPSAQNPNGMSELAVLMRLMLADLQSARADILEQRTPAPLLARHQKLRCSWPTEPHMRQGSFDVRAQALLAAEARLDAQPQQARQGFAAVVESCVACHQESCEGPLPLIEALRLP